MDNLDFLDGQPAAEPAAAPEPQAQPDVAATAEGPVRDDKGRFAPKAAEAQGAPVEAAPQAPAITPETAQPEAKSAPPEGYVPLAAFTKLREEFNAYKQQAIRPAEPPPPAPDPYEDFEGYQQWQQGQLLAERADWSFQMAIARHGEDRASEVKSWAAERFATDPIFAQRALSSRDPYGVAFDEWKRDQVISRLSDPALLDRFLTLAGQEQTAPAAAPAAPPLAPTPPRSLASSPSAGGIKPGDEPAGPGVAFDSLFRK